MARVFFVHQNLERAMDALHKLRQAGHVVRGSADCTPQSCAFLAEWHADVLVVCLAKLPAQIVTGDVPHWTSMVRAAQDLARCPIVFVGGNAERLAQAAEHFPQARQCAFEELPKALAQLVPVASGVKSDVG
jgi:hypothetical protein